MYLSPILYGSIRKRNIFEEAPLLFIVLFGSIPPPPPTPPQLSQHHLPNLPLRLYSPVCGRYSLPMPVDERGGLEPNNTIAGNEWASFNLFPLRMDSSYKIVRLAVLSPNFKTFKEPKNRFQGANSVRLCSLADRYDNPIPTRFLAPIDCLKIPTLYSPPLCQWWRWGRWERGAPFRTPGDNLP